MGHAYLHWAENGVILEKDYPYVSGDLGVTQDCMESDKEKATYVITGVMNQEDWTNPPNTGEHIYSKELFKAGLRSQPLVVGMGVPNEFLSYSEGIYTGPCEASEINHAMTAVGYGVDEETGLEYAIIRNSWGTRWGEDGYARVALGTPREGGTCFMWSWASHPVIE